ncbi:hypothetical protein Trydic_g7675 [Trypoxylus dichotomus]
MSGFEPFGSKTEIGWKSNSKYTTFQKSKLDSQDPANDLSSPESIPDIDRPPLRHIDTYLKPECPCLSARSTVALLACMGFIVMFGMRCNMGLAKLELRNVTGESLKNADSSIFWGYLITQVPGGFLATQYPANKLFGGAIVTSSLFNLLIPVTLLDAPFVMICIRVIQGLVEGVTYPSCHGIWRYWAPPLERSKLATLAFCGCYAGVMFGIPLCGILVRHAGWQSPFYFYGCMGVIWYIFWLWLVFEKPSKHPTMNTKELLYIQNSLGENPHDTIPKFSAIPWKSFFTSLPVWAIFVANFCRSWNFYLLVLFQASFVSDVYTIDIEENALLGAIPHLTMTIIVPTGGVLADYLRRSGLLTTTQVRKLFNCCGFGMEATFFLVVAFSNSVSVAIAALTIGVAFSGFAISGFNVNHLDIAPKYASILMGLSNGVGTIAGCLCPIVVHRITDNSKNLKEQSEHWKVVFILAAIVHFSGVIFYAIFASGELQPWADSSINEEKQWNPMDENINIKTSSTIQSNGLLQRQLSGKNAINYGSVEEPAPAVVTTTNPFISNTNPFRSESIQPEAQDTYMHGTVEDRTY